MIRRLTTDDEGTFTALRLEALESAPLVFASSPSDDFASDSTRLSHHLDESSDEVIFGAFSGNLVGVVGVYRGQHEKSAHKAHIWGMYVQPRHRGQGVASRLLHAALSHARVLEGVSIVHLSVSSEANEAHQLYLSAGFRPWGTEPDALRYAGRSVSEIHMALVAHPPAA